MLHYYSVTSIILKSGLPIDRIASHQEKAAVKNNEPTEQH